MHHFGNQDYVVVSFSLYYLSSHFLLLSLFLFAQIRISWQKTCYHLSWGTVGNICFRQVSVTCFISHSKIRHPNVTKVKFHSAGKSPLLCSNHWWEHMASKIAGSWIFAVAQILRRFEYLLKSSSDGHANLLYVCYASLGKTFKGKLKPRAIPFQFCTVQTLIIP